MNIYPYFTVQVNNVHWTLDELKQNFCNCSQLLNYWWVLQQESWQGSHGPLILRETVWLQGERLVTPFKNERLVTPFENTKPVLPFEYERPVPPFERRGRYWRLPLEDNCPPLSFSTRFFASSFPITLAKCPEQKMMSLAKCTACWPAPLSDLPNKKSKWNIKSDK